MDNFYLNKKIESNKYDKNIFKKILNNIEINNKIQNNEKSQNGQNDKNNDNKNINLNEANNQLSDAIYNFRICLTKYTMKK